MFFNCPLCEKQFPKLISLSVHFRKFHKGTSKRLYELLFCNGQEPKCGCSCGGEVKFLDMTRGFNEFIRGHASRISGKNNWGNNRTAQKKSQKIRSKMWANGQLKIWNKGLTKETNESVRQYGKSSSNTIKSNSEEIKRRSKQMKKGRMDGTIPTLHGSDASQWKGGVSPLHAVCRKELYDLWIRPHLIRAKFTCEMCGIQGKLEVHHNKESFSSIMRKFAEKYNWTLGLTETIDFEDPKLDKLKKKIAMAVADYHVQNNVSGIVLCTECHSKEHI